MGQLINIEGIDWIRNVANSLQIIFNELQDVNMLLSNFDDFLQQSGKAREFNYNYKSQKAAIQNLENDLDIYKKCFTYYSLSDFVDALIDHPFYTSLEQAVKELSLAQIDRYSTDSVGGIGLKPRQENTSPYSQTIVPNQRITINDVLNTQLSKDMLRLQYEDFFDFSLPWAANLTIFDFQLYYEKFLSQIIGFADFNFKTGKDVASDFIKSGLFLIGMVAFGGSLVGALFGKKVIGFKAVSMAANGTSMLMNIETLWRGTDANGNSLTEEELTSLGRIVVLQASAFGISLYQTVSSLKGAIDPWKNPDGTIKWPPNNGAVPGTEIEVSLKPGTEFGRIGAESGKFVAPPGTDPAALSLAPGTDISNYHEYIVIKEIPGVQQSTAAPWFDMPGGGTQYLLPSSIKDLLQGEFIKLK